MRGSVLMDPPRLHLAAADGNRVNSGLVTATQGFMRAAVLRQAPTAGTKKAPHDTQAGLHKDRARHREHDSVHSAHWADHALSANRLTGTRRPWSRCGWEGSLHLRAWKAAVTLAGTWLYLAGLWQA